MPPGAVFTPFCYYEAAANLLTNPVLDPFGKIPEFKYCAVSLARGGEAAVNTGYDAEPVLPAQATETV
jgi:formate dehydrogenase major subunit